VQVGEAGLVLLVGHLCRASPSTERYA
jgi:hypothetical protein